MTDIVRPAEIVAYLGPEGGKSPTTAITAVSCGSDRPRARHWRHSCPWPRAHQTMARWFIA